MFGKDLVEIWYGIGNIGCVFRYKGLQCNGTLAGAWRSKPTQCEVLNMDCWRERFDILNERGITK